MYFVIFIMGTDEARRVSLIALSVIQAFCGAYGFIAPREAWVDNYRIRYILNETELGSELKGINHKTDRVKSDPLTYESNYALISDCAAISYWSYGAAPDLERVLRKEMGYDGDISYLMDTGGTVFSDALLGVKYSAAAVNPDKMLYDEMEGRPHLFKSRYTLPFGVFIEPENPKADDASFMEFHNLLFNEIYETDQKLIMEDSASEYISQSTPLTDEEAAKIRKFFDDNAPKERAYSLAMTEDTGAVNTDETSDAGEASSKQEGDDTDSETEYEDGKTYKHILSVPVSGLKSLYLCVPEDYESTLTFIKDGEPVYFNSFITYGSNYYPNGLRNGIQALGTYEDETYEVELYTEDKELKDVSIGMLDLDLLSEAVKASAAEVNLNTVCGKKGLRMNGSVNKDGRLFIPVAYSDSWSAKVNGRDAKIIPCIDNAFISLDVSKGNVDIKLTYRPKGLMTGLCLTALGIVFAILLAMFLKKGGLKGKKSEKVFDRIFIYAFNSVAAAMFIIMYIIPIYIKMAI
nr:YfhO family protein [Lachnospiraceae bacterium]